VVDFIPKIKIEIVIQSDWAEKVIETIKTSAANRKAG
jgi:nitrogen regulatory protein PII